MGTRYLTERPSNRLCRPAARSPLMDGLNLPHLYRTPGDCPIWVCFASLGYGGLTVFCGWGMTPSEAYSAAVDRRDATAGARRDEIMANPFGQWFDRPRPPTTIHDRPRPPTTACVLQ